MHSFSKKVEIILYKRWLDSKYKKNDCTRALPLEFVCLACSLVIECALSLVECWKCCLILICSCSSSEECCLACTALIDFLNTLCWVTAGGEPGPPSDSLVQLAALPPLPLRWKSLVMVVLVTTTPFWMYRWSTSLSSVWCDRCSWRRSRSFWRSLRMRSWKERKVSSCYGKIDKQHKAKV